MPDREALTPSRPRPYESPGRYEKGRAKRRQILDAALALIAANGYGNTSLQQIADAANLTKAGLLHHVGSKEDLLTDYFSERYRRVAGNVRADISHAADAGELRPGLDAEMVSRILIAVADGLQQQWQYDRSIDMAAHLDYLWSLLGTAPPRDLDEREDPADGTGAQGGAA
ncbi:TetR family transcriptional regulator [Nonomuraea polychroma]|uniref:TetR family transcriptional regulator n=1 Tax=Nonomuraea polychroma TaxID=46176 RepID=A0A438M751_9ACTN|nr:TetR/AcrR family transcriptional regulator [Nonomuraea polychroma]RVX41540.1 TetR family transcriptional regulator [Nonomuraea polychroma]